MSVLAFENVTLRYNSPGGETVALKDFTCRFRDGEFTAIVGPSGCGKSSLLSLAAGLIKPDEGSVTLDGAEIAGPMKNIGYMLQSDHLFSWLTIEKNAYVGLKVRKMLNDDTKRYVRDLLEGCGLSSFVNSYPYQLSGGMRQRAALVRTLALDPDILLLDEPFSALDYQTRLTVSRDVHEVIKKSGKTAVLVTHDIIEAVSLADRIVVMTGRPGSVKAEHIVELAGSPIERRRGSAINDYFYTIWKELDLG